MKYYKHGLCKHPLYRRWNHIKSRCYNKKDSNYAYYGGRGITVCDEWRRNFKQFLDDIGERPTPDHSIDRSDNDGNYTPDNCRWATRTEQSRNKRTYKNNKSGVAGVTWHARDKKWRVRIDVTGKEVNLGCFIDLSEATDARQQAEYKYWG